MKKVVINRCFGGFSLSPEAQLWLLERCASLLNVRHVQEYFGDRYDAPASEFGSYKHALADWHTFQQESKDRTPEGMRRRSMFLTVFLPDEQHVVAGDRDIARDHPILVECVQTLGLAANGSCADLHIVEIPDDVEFQIEEYDGMEHVAEKHRTWS